jgi:nitrite reductase (NADH) small subunit
MPLVKVASLDAVAPESVIEVLVDDYPYAICNHAGEIRALSGICIHRGGPLGQGQVHDGRVVCPYHMWEFDCRTGEYDYDPSKRVPTFEVRIEGTDILLQVPDRA